MGQHACTIASTCNGQRFVFLDTGGDDWSFVEVDAAADRLLFEAVFEGSSFVMVRVVR
jgi:hypothetical protein